MAVLYPETHVSFSMSVLKEVRSNEGMVAAYDGQPLTYPRFSSFQPYSMLSSYMPIPLLILFLAGKWPLAFLVAVHSSSGLMRHSALFVSKGSLAPAFV